MRGRWHGVPYSGMLLIGFMVAFGLILARTTYGEAVYAVGGNYEASRLSGLRVRSIVASSYVLLGACVGMAGSITAIPADGANVEPLLPTPALRAPGPALCFPTESGDASAAPTLSNDRRPIS